MSTFPGRPLAPMSISELEEKAVRASSNKDLRQQLVHELAFRKTPRAQALLKRLQSPGAKGQGPIPSTPSPQRKAIPGPVAPVPAPKPPQSTSDGSAKPGANASSSSRRSPSDGVPAGASTSYERLLQLVGQEAEELGRWGLAPGAPKEVMRDAFDYWAGHVGPEPDLHGRSKKSLQVVRERYAV